VARRLILDTGAVLAYVRQDEEVVAAIEEARSHLAEVVVPPAVVTEAIRGGGRDAGVHRLLKASYTSWVGKKLACEAGALIGATDGPSPGVADAQVVAEAVRTGNSTILTSDPEDLTVLAGRYAGRRVRIVALTALH